MDYQVESPDAGADIGGLHAVEELENLHGNEELEGLRPLGTKAHAGPIRPPACSTLAHASIATLKVTTTRLTYTSCMSARSARDDSHRALTKHTIAQRKGTA